MTDTERVELNAWLAGLEGDDGEAQDMAVAMTRMDREAGV